MKEGRKEGRKRKEDDVFMNKLKLTVVCFLFKRATRCRFIALRCAASIIAAL